VQHYDSDILDASLLLMPLCKFIAPTDPRWLSTLDAMESVFALESIRITAGLRSPSELGRVGRRFDRAEWAV
jgi:hypothetical protein